MTTKLLSLAIVSLLAIGSAPAAGACPGDCNVDRRVTVDELVVAVNIGLGSTSVDRCTAADADGDGAVTIGEIVGAVNAALNGCPDPAPPPRLIALSREGGIASLDITAPWTVRASGDLGATIASARCRGGRCLVVHPSVDSVSVVDATDLSVDDPIVLERGADPRDVALIDDRTAIISQYGSAALLEIDLVTRATTPIDLRPLADADGLPETLRLAACGRRVFVQLLRINHETDAPTLLGPGLAVIDLDRPAGERVVDVDPATPGLQAIALTGRPNFDMPVDCAAGILYIAEPAPLMQGGGAFERVDLATLTAAEFPIDPGAEVGGFEVVSPAVYWLITHTEFGPGPSSHLTLTGGTSIDTHNTFSSEHVDDLALDREADLLFYPDPCNTLPSNPSCDPGIFVFHAHTGEPAAEQPIALDFPAIEVVVSR